MAECELPGTDTEYSKAVPDCCELTEIPCKVPQAIVNHNGYLNSTAHRPALALPFDIESCTYVHILGGLHI